ncbi:MAG TPA: signal recognition particle protein [bacterium]|mgnify:CR=1 FL=1|nr:signal recognition particle protein [bacterium]
MFESISSKFQDIFRSVRGVGRLSEKNISDSLRAVRLALLEADVNYRVVKRLVDEVREDSLGREVLSSIKPGQQFVKCVHERLVEIMTSSDSALALSGSPAVVMLIGLQGSGKTTTAAKLALRLYKQGRRPLLAAADLTRPAAVDQLRILGERAGVEVASGEGVSPLKNALDAIEYARIKGLDMVILDTSGRLHIDSELMEELDELKRRVRPCQTLLVLDAMTGQDAVNAAGEFDRRIGIEGSILTKLDGDARGGAAISMLAVTGKPVKFAGVGEGMEDLAPFDPGGMASRILGMGDVVGLVNRAQELFDDEESRRLEKKLRKADFDLEDFRRQLFRFKKLGSWRALEGMLPAGMPKVEGGDERLRRMGAILDSMTPGERRRPEILNGSRRERIARGSGTSVREVNQLLKKFAASRKMMTKIGKMNGKRMNTQMGGANWQL